MTESHVENQSGEVTEFLLHPYRSLSPKGFLVLMVLIGFVSFSVGIAFLLMGAWPVTGFFGLDVALIYFAFKLNYRSGRAYERISLTSDLLKLTRVLPTGQREVFDFNPYWAQVKLTTDRPDGRTTLALRAQGREISFGRFLTDDERREFADVLSGALIRSRSVRM